MHALAKSLGHLAASALVVIAVGAPALAGPAKAPFGDKVDRLITSYDRASPYIGTAGLLKAGGVAEAKRLGFVAILDLLGPDEAGGVAAERAAAKAAGLRFFHIPVTTRAPTWDQVRAFAPLIEDRANYPILVHCETANRVGAMWAMYRVMRGVDAQVAIEEGRAIGLTSREGAVRKRLASMPNE